jgi:cold shock CspA family protein/ribosome-associated translation inhibitor RaiA
MELPLQITFRDVPPSAAVEVRIREEAEALQRFYDRIQRCRVVVELPHRHHHQGRVYDVRIDLTVPGREIVIGRDPALNHAHEDLYVAIRDAFDAAKRQLQDHIRREREHGNAHPHTPATEGRVARIFRDEGYGFIETADGREVYFHRNSVVDGDFDRLAGGTPVRFTEELGEKGPQATTVHPRRRPGTPARGATGAS